MPELQVIARYAALPGTEPELLSMLSQFARLVRSETGNVSFEFYQQVDARQKIVLLERYLSRQAFAEHCETPHFRGFVLEQFIPRLESRTIELFDADSGEPEN